MSDSDIINSDGTSASDAAIGAVAALIRVCELYDPAVAHRAALRAVVADKLSQRVLSEAADDAFETRPDRAVSIASAALLDIDLVVSRPADPEAADEPTRPLLGATIVRRIPGLSQVADTIEEHRADWKNISAPARIAAVVDELVGNPAAGFVPTWDHGLRRTDQRSRTHLDPALCVLLHELELEDIEPPLIPSATIIELLDAAAKSTEPVVDVTETISTGRSRDDDATTIKTAVAAAGHTDNLLELFAQSAQRTARAAEIVVMRLSPTEIDPVPAARVSDDLAPPFSLDRLDDLREFSTQAELRAGVTLERSLGGNQTDELIVPIIVEAESWGLLIATRRPEEDEFDAHDLSVLRHIANEAADAVESTAHWAQMERMALRDQLTGLANRHELYRVLDGIFERPPLERIDCALIMCDVDGLKLINDTMGHQAGDRLLIDAAAALRGAVRDPDRTTICRIGGDEFCLVIDGGALLTAHDVSDMIERLFARSAGSGPPRSISCGIAFANEDIESRSALLRAADESQYLTKRARKASREEVLDRVVAEAGPAVDRRAIRD
jgi:diguanylate cyclase (GGDEF)-like protein